MQGESSKYQYALTLKIAKIAKDIRRDPYAFCVLRVLCPDTCSEANVSGLCGEHT